MDHYDEAPGRHQRLGKNRPANPNSGCWYYCNFSPLVFILFIKTYAFYTLISLFSYLWIHEGSKAQAILELFLTCFLTFMAIWSLISAVFTHPGKPRGNLDEESFLGSENNHVEFDLDEIEGNQGQMGKKRRNWKSTEDQDSQHHSSSSISTSNQQQHLNDEEEEDEEEEERYEDQDNLTAPLLSSTLANNLPLGQPKYPARSGRSQLNQIKNLTQQKVGQSKLKGKGKGKGKGGNLMVKSNGSQRWCKKCNGPKPDRCHHCSTCGTCVLRMDHHCPWLASRCVGLRNHKAFFLFLMYTALLAIYTAQEMARALLVFVEREIDGFENSPITWAISLFIGFIFGMALLPFGLYHLYLILKNRTTIESMEGSGRVRIASKSHSHSNHNNSSNESDQPRMSIEDRLKGLTSTSSSTQTQRRKPTWKPDESLTKPERKLLKKANKLNIYNVGAFKNWKFIMGDNWIYCSSRLGNLIAMGLNMKFNEETLVELRRITEEVRGGVESRERRGKEWSQSSTR